MKNHQKLKLVHNRMKKEVFFIFFGLLRKTEISNKFVNISINLESNKIGFFRQFEKLHF